MRVDPEGKKTIFCMKFIIILSEPSLDLESRSNFTYDHDYCPFKKTWREKVSVFNFQHFITLRPIQSDIKANLYPLLAFEMPPVMFLVLKC